MPETPPNLGHTQGAHRQVCLHEGLLFNWEKANSTNSAGISPTKLAYQTTLYYGPFKCPLLSCFFFFLIPLSLSYSRPLYLEVYLYLPLPCPTQVYNRIWTESFDMTPKCSVSEGNIGESVFPIIITLRIHAQLISIWGHFILKSIGMKRLSGPA